MEVLLRFNPRRPEPLERRVFYAIAQIDTKFSFGKVGFISDHDFRPRAAEFRYKFQSSFRIE
jgi:hypothetical protein